MKGVGRAATVAALLLPLAGAPLAAQSWKADLGVNGGASWYSPLLGSDEVTTGTGNVRFRAGWLLGAQAGYWFTPRIGIQANGTYTDRPLKQGNGFFSENTELWHDVNLWSGTGDLMFRFKQPSATFRREALPYIALGLGAKWISPAGSGAFVAANGTSTNNGIQFACGPLGCAGAGNTFATVGVTGVPGVIGVNAGTATPVAGLTNFFLPKQHVLMGLAGLGADFRMAPHVALRLEAGDRIYKPKVWMAAPGTTVAGATTELVNGTTNVAKTVHEVYAQLGIHYLMGLAAPPVVAVAPAPAPPPPAAPPPPTTQDVSVCEVNLTAPGGLSMVTAQVNPTTNDTTVIVNGTAVPLSQSITGIPVASSATWYVQGQPLVIGTGRSAISYVSFGSARNIDMNDLTYIGTVNGLPVYANRTDVATLTIPTPPGEIMTNTGLVTGLRNVQVLYVPLTPTGCNFQPIQLQQAVRKTRQ